MVRPFTMRRLCLTLWAFVALWVAVPAAQGFLATFDDDLAGTPPRGFLFSWVRQPSAGLWEVRGGGHRQYPVHVADASLQGRSVAVSSAVAPAHVRVIARMRLVDGSREGGLVWRYRDGHNGYVAGVSLLRREAILFRVTAGNRVQLDRLDDLDLDPTGGTR